MHSTEIFFLVGFIIFIAAILILDMLVIDRKAHAVSIKEAGTWTAVWITLALAFSAFLWYYGGTRHSQFRRFAGSRLAICCPSQARPQ